MCQMTLLKFMVFRQKFLKDKETFEQISQKFLDFIENKKIIIHNATFDLSFLNGELTKINKPKIDKNP